MSCEIDDDEIYDGPVPERLLEAARETAGRLAWAGDHSAAGRVVRAIAEGDSATLGLITAGDFEDCGAEVIEGLKGQSERAGNALMLAISEGRLNDIPLLIEGLTERPERTGRLFPKGGE